MNKLVKKSTGVRKVGRATMGYISTSQDARFPVMTLTAAPVSCERGVRSKIDGRGGKKVGSGRVPVSGRRGDWGKTRFFGCLNGLEPAQGGVVDNESQGDLARHQDPCSDSEEVNSARAWSWAGSGGLLASLRSKRAPLELGRPTLSSRIPGKPQDGCSNAVMVMAVAPCGGTLRMLTHPWWRMESESKSSLARSLAAGFRGLRLVGRAGLVEELTLTLPCFLLVAGCDTHAAPSAMQQAMAGLEATVPGPAAQGTSSLSDSSTQGRFCLCLCLCLCRVCSPSAHPSARPTVASSVHHRAWAYR